MSVTRFFLVSKMVSCFFNEKNEQNFAKFLLEFFKNKKKEERKKCTDELDEMHRRLLMFRTTRR